MLIPCWDRHVWCSHLAIFESNLQFCPRPEKQKLDTNNEYDNFSVGVDDDVGWRRWLYDKMIIMMIYDDDYYHAADDDINDNDYDYIDGKEYVDR